MIALSEAKSGNMERAHEAYRRALALRESHDAEPKQFEIYRQQAEALLFER